MSSIWLVPKRSEQLQATIEKLSAELKTPPFPAHVTLISTELTVTEACSKAKGVIPQLTSKLFVSLDKLAFQPCSVFQCVYILLDGANADLAQLRRTSERVFGNKYPGQPYMPHLSLVYGDEKVTTQRVRQTNIRRRCPLPEEKRSLPSVTRIITKVRGRACPAADRLDHRAAAGDRGDRGVGHQ